MKLNPINQFKPVLDAFLHYKINITPRRRKLLCYGDKSKSFRIAHIKMLKNDKNGRKRKQIIKREILSWVYYYYYHYFGFN